MNIKRNIIFFLLIVLFGLNNLFAVDSEESYITSTFKLVLNKKNNNYINIFNPQNEISTSKEFSFSNPDFISSIDTEESILELGIKWSLYSTTPVDVKARFIASTSLVGERYMLINENGDVLNYNVYLSDTKDGFSSEPNIEIQENERNSKELQINQTELILATIGGPGKMPDGTVTGPEKDEQTKYLKLELKAPKNIDNPAEKDAFLAGTYSGLVLVETTIT